MEKKKKGVLSYKDATERHVTQIRSCPLVSMGSNCRACILFSVYSERNQRNPLVEAILTKSHCSFLV